MERYTVTASFNRSSIPQTPIFQNNETTSLPCATIPPNSHLKEASFSSYLRPNSSSKPPIDDTEISIFDAERYFNENPDKKPNSKSPSPPPRLERVCDVSTISRRSSVSSADGYGRNYRTGSFHATPTSSSEASWNSQTGLLSNPPGSIAVSIKNLPLNEQRKGYSKKWLFGRKCPCSGRKSVDVEEKLPESRNPVHINSISNGSLNLKKQSYEKPAKEMASKSFEAEAMAKLKLVGGNWAKDKEVLLLESEPFSPESDFPSDIGRRIVHSGRSFADNGFSFPILNPTPVAGKLLLNGASPLEEPPRESLEVFRPSDEMGVCKSAEFQRRMVMLPFSGDAGRRSFTFPSSPKAREDDVASDSSSDLFEIESFSTQATSVYRRRESLDEAARFGSAAAGILQLRRTMEEGGEWYEPSEASVEWSVTTAEGFDRGSVANFSTSASDYEDARSAPAAGTADGGGGKRKGTGGLLSCRCEKAVSVGPHPVKCGPDHQRVGPTSLTVDTARIAAMSRFANAGPAHVPRPSDGPLLARSHSARLSRALATR